MATSNKKRRKKRKYRLVLPWKENAANNAAAIQPGVKKKKKKRRLRFDPRKIRFKKPNFEKILWALKHLRKEVWFAIAGVVALICLITIPRAVETNKLKKLGYDKETIAAIREQKLAKTLLDNQWYSDYLASCLKSKTVNTDYLELYTVIEGEKYLDDTDFLMVNRLRDIGYEEDQILNLYKNLRFVELTPLLCYDYQLIEQNYIDDCLNHPENDRTTFVLSNSYRKPYEITYAADPSKTSMLVNKTWYLDESYVPANLTDLSMQCGAAGTRLAKEAADAMEEWAAAGREMNLAFYAISAYRSYDSQKTLYDNYVIGHGQEQADRESARPGFSEHQTGLTADVTATGDESKDFSETSAFIWASANCADYGWILRYPEGKEDITGYEYESWHYRYLGKELAQAVTKTGMTYDEFWNLYLKPWSDENNIPSESILANTDWHNLLKEPEPAPAEGEASSEASPEAGQAG